jgi:hypothetical protein
MHTPRVTSFHHRTVKFGPPNAIEFDSHNPVGALIPVPAQLALKRFPVEHQTKRNLAMLADWDDSFSVFEDDGDDDAHESCTHSQGHYHSLGFGIGLCLTE